MRCLSCGSSVPDGFLVCDHCGKPMTTMDSLVQPPVLPDLAPGLPDLSIGLPSLSPTFPDLTSDEPDLASAREELALVVAVRASQLRHVARPSARRVAPAPARPVASSKSSNHGMVGCVVALALIVVLVLIGSQILLGAIHLGAP